jgi:hypothetical protein
MPRIPFLDTLFTWLKLRLAPGRPPSPGLEPQPHPGSQPPAPGGQDAGIAWGAHVSAAFRHKVIAIAARLAMDPNHLMAIMAFETGRSFDPAVTNHAGSGATGLIQFMPATARSLGTHGGPVADERHRPARLCRSLSHPLCGPDAGSAERLYGGALSARRRQARAITCCFERARRPTSSTAGWT